MFKYLMIIFALVSSLNASNNLNYKKYFKNKAGTKAYKSNNLEKSIKKFNENAISNPNDGALHYNLGNAFFKRQQFEEAETEYNLALKDKNLKKIDDVYHNLGNIKLSKKELPKAVEYFKKALLENPNNLQARYNYELASKLLQKKNKDQKKQGKDNKNNKDKKKDKNKQENKDNKDKNKQNKKDKQQQDKQDDKQNKQNKQQKDKQKGKPKQQKINKQMANQILKNIEEQEKKNQKKKKVPVKINKNGKYW